MKRTSITTTAFVVTGLVVALMLAFAVSPHASSQPDGLERVAADQGFDAGVRDSKVADSPLADYGVEGVDSAWLSTGLSGVIGVALTFAVGSGLLRLMRLLRSTPSPA
jgi:hypothetical protein